MDRSWSKRGAVLAWLMSFVLVASLLPIMGQGSAFAAEVALDESAAEPAELAASDPALDEAYQAAEAEQAALLAARAISAADLPALTLSFTTNGTAVVLPPQEVDGALYFFIPSGVSLAEVALGFDAPADGKLCISDPHGSHWFDPTPGEPLNLGTYLSPLSDSERSFTVGLMVGGQLQATAEYRVMQSANVASVFLTSADPATEGRDYIDGSANHSTKASGSIRVLSSSSAVRYAGEFSAIKGRGNTSWTAASKKSYQVKLEKKADLLDVASHEGASEKAKKWLLIGNPFDPTLMRNEMTYQFAKTIGMPAAVDAETVDLFYDGEYRGTYLLTEKVEVGSGRVEIADLEADVEKANPGADLETLPTMRTKTSYGADMQYVSGVKDPTDYTGGYLLELDDGFYASEKSWFAASSGQHFVSKSPEFLSANQMRYVSALVNDALVCMNNGGRHPSTGKRLFDYFDKESLVKWFFVQELCKNADEFISSTFFYIPRGETKLYVGPIWDCDGTYGIRNELASFKDPKGWLARNGFDALLKIDEFRSALASTYQTEMKAAAKNLVEGSATSVGSIAYYAAKNASTRQMNAKIWGVAQPVVIMTQYPSYDSALSAMRSWAQQRLSWLDGQLAVSGTTGSTGSTQSMHRMYNPNSGEHFYTASIVERDFLKGAGWTYEGIGWIAPKSSSAPVYRLYSGTDHHYTMSVGERDALIQAGWTYEGIGWYSDDAKRVPLYRQFNPNVDPSAPVNNSGSHNYTVDKNENDHLASIGWQEEGVGWYGCKASG